VIGERLAQQPGLTTHASPKSCKFVVGETNMSRFRGTMSGERGTAIKAARRNLSAKINGWDRGVYVRAYVDENGLDHFEVFKTHGSNDESIVEKIAEFI
jgi:hypothetical protein